MSMEVSNVMPSQAIELKALKKAVEQEAKVKDMPMDSVSFGNKMEDEKPKSKVGIVAAIIGAAALIGTGIWALRRGKTKNLKEAAEQAKSIGEQTTEEALKRRAAVVGADGKPTYDALQAQAQLNKKNPNKAVKSAKKQKNVKSNVKPPKVETHLNADGTKTQMKAIFGPDGKVVSRESKFFDQDGNLTKITVRGGEGGWEPISTTTIKKLGNLTLSKTVTADGTGVKSVVKDASGKVKSTKYQKLDNEKNVIQETYVKKFDANGKPSEKVVRIVQDGQKVEQKFVKNDGVWQNVEDAVKTSKSYGELTQIEALAKRATAVGADGKPTYDALEARKILANIEKKNKTTFSK